MERGLTNYWGYNTIGFFAPHDGYSAAARAGEPAARCAEFKAMVEALHAAGLEVILDVVFNHTAEATTLGPTLCFRGLDNPAYYRLDPDDPSRYFDTTGTGNSLNAGDPRWPPADHGLAALLGHRDARRRLPLRPGRRRSPGRTARSTASSAFFDLVSQDPVVSRVKLIAEPWDVGQADSYDLGRFPPPWSEWNGRYRDTVRDFWRGQDGTLGRPRPRA